MKKYIPYLLLICILAPIPFIGMMGEALLERIMGYLEWRFNVNVQAYVPFVSLLMLLVGFFTLKNLKGKTIDTAFKFLKLISAVLFLGFGSLWLTVSLFRW